MITLGTGLEAVLLMGKWFTDMMEWRKGKTHDYFRTGDNAHADVKAA